MRFLEQASKMFETHWCHLVDNCGSHICPSQPEPQGLKPTVNKTILDGKINEYTEASTQATVKLINDLTVGMV